MKSFALISLNPPIFIRPMDAKPKRIKPGFSVVPQAQEDPPTFNKATHKLVRTRTVTESAVNHRFNVVALDANELERKTIETNQEAQRPNLERWIAKLKAGEATPAQVQKALAWVIQEVM